ncbi:albusnodin family lasso peptide [Nocardiopsis sp. NPDC049922]
MEDQTYEPPMVVDLGDAADLTLGEGSDDNEDKRQIYC